MPPISDRRQPPGVDTRSTRPTDAVLLTQWRAGDRRAAGLLVTRYRAEIARFFGKRAGDHAEELVQRTLEALVVSHRSYRGDASIRRYVFGIAHKILLKHYAESARRHDGEDPDRRSHRDGELASGRALVRSEVTAAVAQALAELPGELRCAIEQHYWGGLTMEELAAEGRTKPGTIKSRLYRGRAQLRDHLLARAPRADWWPVAPGLTEL